MCVRSVACSPLQQHVFCLRNQRVRYSAIATIAMSDIDNALGLAVRQLSDENYAHTLAFCRLWFDIGQTDDQTPTNRLFDAIWNSRGIGSSTIDLAEGKLINSAAHLIVRFANDAESDHLFSAHNSGLQSRLCAKTLREFFKSNLRICCGSGGNVCADANLIAHWANLGYVEEAVIRNHILQSLISHPKLYDHQADALIVLFKLAGPTFEAYTDPSVVDHCFELLKDHKYYNQDLVSYNSQHPTSRTHYSWTKLLNRGNSYDLMKKELIQVRVPRPVKGDHRAKPNPQEVAALRERGWEGLPPPPIFTTTRPNLVSASQRDPATTPVAISLGLPNRDLEPQIPQPPPPELVTAPESDPIPIPASSVTPVTHSPSTSIATLSDFAITDTSDDEPLIHSTIADTSDDELPVDSTATTPHETFYFEDGNAEVLCRNTLFRVHTIILSFHSPVLRRIFAQNNLAAAESPNGCPRILTSDTPEDFATLLKTIYFPGFVTTSACRLIVPLTTYLPTDFPNGIRCRISPHSHPSSESPQSTTCPLSDLRRLRSSAMRTQRTLRDWLLPSRLERASSVVRLLTRMRSSTSSSSRASLRRCQWHTTWRFEGGRIRWWVDICRARQPSLPRFFSPRSEGSWHSVKWSSTRPTV